MILDDSCKKEVNFMSGDSFSLSDIRWPPLRLSHGPNFLKDYFSSDPVLKEKYKKELESGNYASLNKIYDEMITKEVEKDVRAGKINDNYERFLKEYFKKKK